MSETVEVVIRIPKREVEEIKRYCKRVELKISSLEDYIYRSIANGTVLPKGHGRLCDLDTALKCAEELVDNDVKEAALMIFDWACSKRIILEADKEV